MVCLLWRREIGQAYILQIYPKQLNIKKNFINITVRIFFCAGT